jgi:hypothetical protein
MICSMCQTIFAADRQVTPVRIQAVTPCEFIVGPLVRGTEYPTYRYLPTLSIWGTII